MRLAWVLPTLFKETASPCSCWCG